MVILLYEILPRLKYGFEWKSTPAKITNLSRALAAGVSNATELKSFKYQIDVTLQAIAAVIAISTRRVLHDACGCFQFDISPVRHVRECESPFSAKEERTDRSHEVRACMFR
jgi:hypothetical protein